MTSFYKQSNSVHDRAGSGRSNGEQINESINFLRWMRSSNNNPPHTLRLCKTVWLLCNCLRFLWARIWIEHSLCNWKQMDHRRLQNYKSNLKCRKIASFLRMYLRLFVVFFSFRSWGPIDPVHGWIRCRQNGEHEESHSVFGLCGGIQAQGLSGKSAKEYRTN